MGVTDAMVGVQRKISGRREALRVIPRGEQWLTVHRAHQVTEIFGKVPPAENKSIFGGPAGG